MAGDRRGRAHPAARLVWLVVNAVVLLVFTALVEFSPLTVQRPVALGLPMTAVALAWVPALFFLKLLVSHLVLETPFHSGSGSDGALGEECRCRLVRCPRQDDLVRAEG